MSVLIKGMKMPKYGCRDCIFVDFKCYGDICPILKKEVTDNVARCGFHPDCPLAEVPPHGRLIDADALHKLFEDQWHYLQVLDWNENPTAEARQSGVNWCINTMHDSAPTVIEAEEGE